MRFGSVCSGIEAASVAWHPLGWKAAWFSEIEPFPSAVLAHHYPDTPNLGDMKTLPRRILSGEVEAPDLFCGGTPCQAFSVAGLRKSLDDARGSLSLTFCEIADAIDHVRGMRGLHPAIVFWENVPGVLSAKDNAFGCFLAGLAGEDEPLQPPGGKWGNAGAVLGPTRSVAWRTLDAQYFGVAQRRRRVFVVASARDGFNPAAVLFEWDRSRRDIAPSREAGEGASHATAPCLTSSGRGVERTGDTRGQEPVVAVQASQSGVRVNATIGTLDANYGSRRHNGVMVPVAFGGNNQSGPIDVATARNACASASGRMDFETETFLVQPVTHSLRGEGFDASEDGTGRGTPLVPIAFHPTQDPISSTEVCHSIGANENATAAVAHVQIMPTMTSGGPGASSHNQVSGQMRDAYMVPTTAMQVRRLTPVECERLQGFPDGYTAIPWRGKPAENCPDGPRYKALGNSWAVPVVRWIGLRIDAAMAKELT
jgi:DNA (cytosine-5)-methyltransferase 1